MKLFNSMGPNPRAVRMFIAEKNIDIAQQEVNILGGDNLGEEFLRLNPGKQLPFMQLDDGFVLAESLAICEYLEEQYPQIPLLGNNAKQRAETRMWCRRIDLRIMEPSIQGTKASDAYEFFKDRYYLVVSGAEELKTLSRKNLQWLNAQMQGCDYICGNRFSLADIQLWCFLDFGADIRHRLPEDCTTLLDWYHRIAQRPSVAASAHPTEAGK